MTLELKGIRAKAVKAAANIDRLNAAYDKFNEVAPAHAADVEGLAPQIEGLVEDLTFAAQTLGNSVVASNGSGVTQDALKDFPAVPQHEAQKNAPVVNSESLGGISPQINARDSTGGISPQTHTRDSTGAIIHR